MVAQYIGIDVDRTLPQVPKTDSAFAWNLTLGLISSYVAEHVEESVASDLVTDGCRRKSNRLDKTQPDFFGGQTQRCIS